VPFSVYHMILNRAFWGIFSSKYSLITWSLIARHTFGADQRLGWETVDTFGGVLFHRSLFGTMKPSFGHGWILVFLLLNILFAGLDQSYKLNVTQSQFKSGTSCSKAQHSATTRLLSRDENVTWTKLRVTVGAIER
jgi:hypothetical protein